MGERNTAFEISGLSRSARRFLTRHPEEARVIVAEALETAARTRVAKQPGDLPAALAPFVVNQSYSENIIGPSEAAEVLRISRTTVYDWVRRGILLGWHTSKRGLKIPREQILGPERVVPGIPEVLEAVGDPELAWVFLSQDQPFRDSVARPIDKLRSNDVEEVVAVARSFGTATT